MEKNRTGKSSGYEASPDEVNKLISIIEEVADGKYSNDIMFEEIHHHPEIGANILKGLEFLGPVLAYVLHHHEGVNGKGYPDGLKGEDIPMGAKIISVADCFDAITTERPYQKGRNREEAFDILTDIGGKGLAAELVEIFIKDIKENGMF